jgi:hypothetical protein
MVSYLADDVGDAVAHKVEMLLASINDALQALHPAA